MDRDNLLNLSAYPVSMFRLPLGRCGRVFGQVACRVGPRQHTKTVAETFASQECSKSGPSARCRFFTTTVAQCQGPQSGTDCLRERYERDGYVIVPDLLSKKQVGTCKKRAEESQPRMVQTLWLLSALQHTFIEDALQYEHH